MKAKEIIYLLGFKPRVRTYGHDVREFHLPEDGAVRYAQWQHPRETEKIISQSEVDELRTFLKPGDVAIDIGAHTGDSTLPIAIAVGPEGRVFALEPNRYVFAVLEENARLNPSLTNITPLNFAATPEDGACTFEYSDPGFCNGGGHDGISRWKHAHAFKLDVQGRNLETFIRQEHPEAIARLRYIKVDAEGADFAVLRSLESLLRDARPSIRAEVFRHVPEQQRREMIGWLGDLGYEVHKLSAPDSLRGPRVRPDNVMQWKHFDVFCVPQ